MGFEKEAAGALRNQSSIEIQTVTHRCDFEHAALVFFFFLIFELLDKLAVIRLI